VSQRNIDVQISQDTIIHSKRRIGRVLLLISIITLLFFFCQFGFNEEVNIPSVSQRSIVVSPGNKSTDLLIKAINKLCNGGEINLLSGIYKIKKTILIEGVKNLVIKGVPGNTNLITAFEPPAGGSSLILINNCKNIRLEGLSLKGIEVPGILPEKSIDIFKNPKKFGYYSENIYWTRPPLPKGTYYRKIEHRLLSGIRVVNSENIMIAKCSLTKFTEWAINVGLFVDKTLTGNKRLPGPCKNIYILDNHIYNTYKDGIHLMDTENGIIRGNIVENTGDDNISVTNCYTPSRKIIMSENICNGCICRGIAVFMEPGADLGEEEIVGDEIIIANNVIRNTAMGISVGFDPPDKIPNSFWSNIIISNNVCQNMYYSGIYLSKVKGAIVTGNIVENARLSKKMGASYEFRKSSGMAYRNISKGWHLPEHLIWMPDEEDKKGFFTDMLIYDILPEKISGYIGKQIIYKDANGRHFLCVLTQTGWKKLELHNLDIKRNLFGDKHEIGKRNE